MSEQIKVDWKSIRQKAGSYPQEAYQFVRDGLQHTVRTLHGEQGEREADGADRHVSGQELCMGLRDYAINRYGMLARTVLGRWGIHRTDDFGRIVFAMIDAGMMRRSDTDCAEDFRAVYEFDEAFALSDVC